MLFLLVLCAFLDYFFINNGLFDEALYTKKK